MEKKKIFKLGPCTVAFIAIILSLSILLVALPKESYSENEKRVLATFPEFTLKSLADGEFTQALEEYINDHFPGRDIFVGIYSYFNRLSGRGNESGIYLLSDGSLVSAPAEVDIEKCARNLTKLNALSEKLGIPAALIIVPTPGYIKYEELPYGHGEYADDAIFKKAEQVLWEGVELVDLRDIYKSKEESGASVYYNTDHHTTTRGSYLAYLEYCSAMGIEPTENYTNIEKVEGFYGTNYSKSGLWLTKPDTLEIWHSPNNYNYSVVVDDISTQKTHDSLFFMEHAENMDKYPIFLDGNHALVTITNEDVKNGRTLLIVKDSYAHSFSSFVCEQYETVCMVDMRYYRASVSSLATSIGADEILYMFGAENLATMSELALLQ